MRAIAIVTVMGFHAGINGFGGGYFGVDMFFVLSGFLITSLLLAEHEISDRIDLGAFYTRRALRLLPALILLVAAVIILVAIKPDLDEAPNMGVDAPATLFYVVNWVYAFRDHFDVTLLSHTWSLSIEEQFYLLWPILLLATLFLMRRNRWLVVVLLVAGFAISNAARWWMFRSGTSLPRLTYGTDTRAGALLIGCAIGALVTWDLIPRTSRGRLLIRMLGVGGAVLIAWMVFGARYTQAAITVDPERVFGEGYLLIALASALFILWLVVEPSGPTARFLSLPPIVWVGQISYGLYLWHLPIDRLVTEERFGFSPLVTQLVRLLVTVAIVVASYYLLERPFLRVKRRFERRPDRFATSDEDRLRPATASPTSAAP